MANCTFLQISAELGSRPWMSSEHSKFKGLNQFPLEPFHSFSSRWIGMVSTRAGRGGHRGGQLPAGMPGLHSHPCPQTHSPASPCFSPQLLPIHPLFESSPQHHSSRCSSAQNSLLSKRVSLPLNLTDQRQSLGKPSPEGNISERYEYVRAGRGGRLGFAQKSGCLGNYIPFGTPNSWKNLFLSPGCSQREGGRQLKH